MSDMSTGWLPQNPIPNTPAPAATAPILYVTPPSATRRLSDAYGLTAQILVGHCLAATMACDEEAPFEGVKEDPVQEREWPRTFKYGWPNMIATPTPIMVTVQFAGAWYLDYEGVVPRQIVDWVCLEAYRYTTLPFTKEIAAESAMGTSVKYLQNQGARGDAPSQLDRIQQSLILPFLTRVAHSSPWVDYTDT